MNKILWSVVSSTLAMALFAVGLWVSRPTAATCQRLERATGTTLGAPDLRIRRDYRVAPNGQRPSAEII